MIYKATALHTALLILASVRMAAGQQGCEPPRGNPAVPSDSAMLVTLAEGQVSTFPYRVSDNDMQYDYVDYLEPIQHHVIKATYWYGEGWDGQSLTFVSNRAGNHDIWTRPADGSGAAEVVLDRGGPIHEALYSPDDTWLVFREGGVGNGLGDIFAIRPVMDNVAVPLVVTEFMAYSPVLSPDGRWLAYVSVRSGREEVYVRPFPDVGSGLTHISTDGVRSQCGHTAVASCSTGTQLTNSS